MGLGVGIAWFEGSSRTVSVATISAVVRAVPAGGARYSCVRSLFSRAQFAAWNAPFWGFAFARDGRLARRLARGSGILPAIAAISLAVSVFQRCSSLLMAVVPSSNVNS